MRTTRYNAVYIGLATALICLIVYLQALSCGFVNLDDPDYVLNNLAIRQLDGNLLKFAFTAPHAGFWMPLTWISLAVDYQLWGLNPLGYHLTNIMLHALNAGLVVLIADMLCRDSFAESAISPDTKYLYPCMLLLAGLLWGLHPLRVESVAWVTERKDVLNGLFTLGSVLYYLRYAQAQEAPGRNGAVLHYYPIALVLFALSLMAKPVSVVLPLMLLVVDWYPLGRLRKGNLRRVLIEKVPFLVFSCAMAIATIRFAEQSRILAAYDSLSLGQRLIVSGNAIFEYCRMILFPVGILPLHIINASSMPVYAAKTVVVTVICFCMYACRRSRWLPATWLCFVIPLVPVLGFFQNGIQAYASRFTYLPSVAPSVAAAILLAVAYNKAKGVRRRFARMALIILSAALILSYAGMTLILIPVWKDTGTVWSRIIAVQPTGRAYKERGIYHLTTGDYSAAADDLTASIEFAKRAGLPEIYNLFAFRGVALRRQGYHDKAIADLSHAIALFPHPNYYYQRGLALSASGNVREAEDDFRRAAGENGPIEWYRNSYE